MVNKRLPLAAALIATVVLTTAFVASGATNKSNSPVKEAQALVTKGMSPLTWHAPGPAVNASSLKGKTVAFVPITSNIPFVQGIWAAYKQAMQKAGVKAVFFDTQGTPASWTQGIEEAIAQKVDLIQLEGIYPGLVGPAISDAHKAHIPVLESFSHNLGQAHSAGVAGEITYSISTAGRLMADYAVASTGGKVNGVIIDEGDFPLAKYEKQGIVNELKRLCPQTCKTSVVSTTVAEWATKLPSLTSTAVQDKSVNFLFPLFDGELVYIAPALHQAGAQNRVKVASFNATAGIMKYLANHDVLAADVGDPIAWIGYIFADQSFRVLSGAAPLPSTKEPVPMMLFTNQNFKASMLKQPEWRWYGKSNFQAKYLKYWSLGK